MRVLVFSHHHGLLPFCWRLKREGHDVETVVWNGRYSRAWEGRLEKLVQGKPSPENLAEHIELAKAGELVVLTDSRKGQELFADAEHLFGVPSTIPWAKPPNLCLCTWWSGSAWQAPHWVVPDWGLWPGGLGASTLGGATLLRTPRSMSMPDELETALLASKFRGLVVLGLEYMAASRELVPTGFAAGWPFLFSHLFLSSLENFGDLLSGSEPVFAEKAFEVAIPVTQPPWPLSGAPGPEPIRLHGLNNDIARQCFFHDLALKGGEVWTAGLDGLVAVVRGAGASLGAAQTRALAVAAALPLPQKQVRSDVGAKVPTVLMGLEELGYL